MTTRIYRGCYLLKSNEINPKIPTKYVSDELRLFCLQLIYLSATNLMKKKLNGFTIFTKKIVPFLFVQVQSMLSIGRLTPVTAHLFQNFSIHFMRKSRTTKSNVNTLTHIHTYIHNTRTPVYYILDPHPPKWISRFQSASE